MEPSKWSRQWPSSNALFCAIFLLCIAAFPNLKWSSTCTASFKENTIAKASTATTSSFDELVPVFYNLYTAEASDSERVTNLVLDQLSMLQPEHKVFVRSIGYPLDIPNTTLLAHRQEGDETDTLHELWTYCTIQPKSKVVYLHSKGSFHSKPENELLRSFLTTGALSRECLELPKSCNICSSRMSPIPHPHTPGNLSVHPISMMFTECH
jgi:hypothetical protein